MERELPEIEILGTTFLFDINRVCLIEKKNPHNKISFSHMQDKGTHYSFEYSAVFKNYHFIKGGTFPSLLSGNIDKSLQVSNPVIRIEIPRIAKIDPEGMCRKYGCSLQDLKQKNDFEIMVNQDVYNRRLKGEPVTVDLAGKKYVVDVNSNSLRSQNGIGDEIFLNDYRHIQYDDDNHLYHLCYNTLENRIEKTSWNIPIEKKENCIILELYHPYSLDPIGANIKYGINPKHGLIFLEHKMNHKAKVIPWELYTNPEVYDLRVNKGMLPTIDIEGHTFYVDIRMDKLRSKDDFLSNGIVFSDIANYFNDDTDTYIIPYDPKKKELGEIDYETITEIPKDLVVVEIPSEDKLDPIGWNRQNGFDILNDKKEVSFEMNFTAKQCKWEDIYVPQKIKENLKQMEQSKQDEKKDMPDKDDQNQQRKRDRKM
jgi:hypothetical protein